MSEVTREEVLEGLRERPWCYDECGQQFDFVTPEAADKAIAYITQQDAEIERLRERRFYTQSDMERARAQAFSMAADTACNEWNRLNRTTEWCAMTGHFQLIWKNLKNISEDYHKLADEMKAEPQ